MSAKQHRRNHGLVCLLAPPTFKPGDKPPSGRLDTYLNWHEWADVQRRAGIRQSQCSACGRWITPQEREDHGHGKCKA